MTMPYKTALTKEEREQVKKELIRGVPATVLARERGVSAQTIRNTRRRNYASDEAQDDEQ
jgi:IS30 family transposase